MRTKTVDKVKELACKLYNERKYQKRGPGRPRKIRPEANLGHGNLNNNPFEIISEPINSWRGGKSNPAVNNLVDAMMKLPVDNKTAIMIGTSFRATRESALAYYTTAHRRIQNDKAGNIAKFTYRVVRDMKGKYTGFKIYRLA